MRHALAALGAATRHRAAFLLTLAAVTFGVLREAPRRATWRRTIRTAFRRALRQSLGSALGMVAFTAALVGVAMVFQALYWLRTAGQEGLVGPVLVTVLVHELTPLLVGTIRLGRSDMVAVTELGAARVGGQVRALDGQGVDPFQFLVLPRAIAGALAAFTLGVVFVAVAVVVGHAAGSVAGAVEVSLFGFVERVLQAMRWLDFAVFPAKLLLIGLVVALASCLTGLAAGPSDDPATLLPRGFTRGVTAILLCSLTLSVLA